MAHCQLFQKISVCTNAFAFRKFILEDCLGQCGEQASFASCEFRPWLTQTLPVTMLSTRKYIVTNLHHIYSNHQGTLQGRLWPTQWLIFDWFFFPKKTKQNKRFGFNLLVVIYGIFNFLVVVGMDRLEGMTQEMAVRNQKVSCVLWITEVTASS